MVGMTQMKGIEFAEYLDKTAKRIIEVHHNPEEHFGRGIPGNQKMNNRMG